MASLENPDRHRVVQLARYSLTTSVSFLFSNFNLGTFILFANNLILKTEIP